MKTFKKILVAISLVALGAVGGAAFTLGSNNTTAVAEELVQDVSVTMENVGGKIEETRFDRCRARYLKDTGCYQQFKPNVCEAEVLKACK